jgi:hypothetical protein
MAATMVMFTTAALTHLHSKRISSSSTNVVTENTETTTRQLLVIYPRGIHQTDVIQSCLD